MKPVPAQRGTKGFYGGAEDQVTQLNVNLLHDMGYDGTGVVVAVLDGVNG